MKKNFISVVIPAHNEESVITKAINLVLKSTYKNYEIIVVNNGSTDKTREIVEGFVKKYPKRIRLLNFNPPTNKESAIKRGPAFSRNRGAEVAKGNILLFLDADDWVIPDTLENIITAFEKYKEIDFIVGNREAEIPKSWKRILLYYWIWRKKFLMWSERISYTEPYCPYIMKTREFFKIGKFNEKAYYHEDIEFRLRLEKSKIPYLISKSIHYYTDMGSHFSDFKRQANNTAKGFMTDPFRLIGVLIQTLLSFLTFPIFYLSFFSIMMWRTGDIYVSIFSPPLWIIRRILEFYYLLKLAIK